jgi:hypothetical protein
MPATKQREATHKNWKCPVEQCGKTYTSPLPILEVTCDNVRYHPRCKLVEMKPDDA